MSTDIGNLVCDAVADPPRISEQTSLKEQIRIQEQKNPKIPINPEIGSDTDKRNRQRSNLENGNATDDRDEKEQERKPRRKSRKNSSSSNNRGMTINNVVSGSTNVCINFSNQTQINLNANGASAGQKDKRERSKEATREMPQYIKDLAECQLTISTLDKLTTKQYIGDNWKYVAKNLDLKKSEVEQCFMDHSKEGIGEVMFQVLTIWNHRFGKLATLGALIKALWSAEEYVCAEELAAIHKS